MIVIYRGHKLTRQIIGNAVPERKDEIIKFPWDSRTRPIRKCDAPSNPPVLPSSLKRNSIDDP